MTIDIKKLSRCAVDGLKDAPALARSTSALLQVKNLPIDDAIERARDRGNYSWEADAWLFRAIRFLYGIGNLGPVNKVQAVDRAREQLEAWIRELGL